MTNSRSFGDPIKIESDLLILFDPIRRSKRIDIKNEVKFVRSLYCEQVETDLCTACHAFTLYEGA